MRTTTREDCISFEELCINQPELKSVSTIAPKVCVSLVAGVTRVMSRKERRSQGTLSEAARAHCETKLILQNIRDIKAWAQLRLCYLTRIFCCPTHAVP